MSTENERLRAAVTESAGRERVLREQEKHQVSQLVSSDLLSSLHILFSSLLTTIYNTFYLFLTSFIVHTYSLTPSSNTPILSPPFLSPLTRPAVTIAK